MKKTIRIRMTNERCMEITGMRGKGDLALPEVEIDMGMLSPPARFIAEHITATYVIDELRDVIGISAISGFTMLERDRKAGKSEDYIKKFSRCYGPIYTDEPIRIDEITFPIYGKSFNRPEDVIEDSARQLINAGAVKLVAKNGDVFSLS